MKSISISILITLGLLCSNACALDAQKAKSLSGNQNNMQTTAEINKAKGAAFLETNKSQPGVVTLADGLQYKIIIACKGEKPKLEDTVEVHYAGRLINGTEFDSSYRRGMTATFPLRAVISGWTEALQLMSVGSTWELYIPATLAYGSRGAPPAIGPNETLIFKVELIGIKK